MSTEIKLIVNGKAPECYIVDVHNFRHKGVLKTINFKKNKGLSFEFELNSKTEKIDVGKIRIFWAGYEWSEQFKQSIPMEKDFTLTLNWKITWDNFKMVLIMLNFKKEDIHVNLKSK